MASSFPRKDGVPPPQIPSNPPNYSFFNEESIRLSFKMPDESRHVDAQRHGFDYTESLEREIIKQRIRAEIMAEELARRRVLEQEIRMELMLEREMAMRRTESTAPRVDSYPGASQIVHDSSVIAQSLGYPEGRRLPLSVQREVGFPGFEPLPFQRHPLAALSEPRKETILLAKPETYISDLKREAPISVADHHRASCTGSVKKPKGIIGMDTNPFNNVSIDTNPLLFSCDACNIELKIPVSLSEHLGRKRYKANGEALAARVQVNGESALESGSNRKKDRESQLETTPVGKQSKKQKKHENADSTPNRKSKTPGSNENGKSEKPTPNTRAKASSMNENAKSVQPTPNTKAKTPSSNENGKSEKPMPNTKAKAPSTNENGKSEKPTPNTKAKAPITSEDGMSEHPAPNSKAKAPSSSENGKSEQPTPNTEAKAPSLNGNGKSDQSMPNSKAKASSLNENGKSEQSMPITKAKVSSSSEYGKSEHPAPNSKAEFPSSSENDQSEQSTPNTKAKASSLNKDGKSTPQGTDNNMNFWCEMCQVGKRTPGGLADHERGKRHRQNLRKCGEAAGVAEPSMHDEVKNLETKVSN